MAQSWRRTGMNLRPMSRVFAARQSFFIESPGLGNQLRVDPDRESHGWAAWDDPCVTPTHASTQRRAQRQWCRRAPRDGPGNHTTLRRGSSGVTGVRLRGSMSSMPSTESITRATPLPPCQTPCRNLPSRRRGSSPSGGRLQALVRLLERLEYGT
jgi:hypothetical protein